MTDDLSTRLLAAIDEAEVTARSCIDEVGPERAGDMFTDGSGDADRDSFPCYPWGSDARELAYMAGPGHPDTVLRLCQAHREIVEMYQKAKNSRSFSVMPDLDHASAMGRLTALGKVLEVLDHAYRDGARP